MKTIVTIIGARPQFIKCAPVSSRLRRHFKEIIIHTGQYYDDDMSNNFFQLLNIPEPDYNLNCGSDTHTIQTAKMMIGIDKLLCKIKPNLVLLYGDTNSTLAGVLSAAKLLIPVAHVEAGLRSYNKKMPEELNRICTDHFSDFLFCPSETAVENLINEGINNNVFNVGDVMKDAVYENISKIDNKKIIDKYGLNPDEKYYFMTIHRQENTDDVFRLKNILQIASLAKYKVLFSIHPRTKNILKKQKVNLPPNVIPLNPLNYLESLALQKFSQIILTDSGGIQKEAYFLKKPCITLRKETEWTETVDYGYNIIVNDDINKFVLAETKFLKQNINYELVELYGNGEASSKIVEILNERF